MNFNWTDVSNLRCASKNICCYRGSPIMTNWFKCFGSFLFLSISKLIYPHITRSWITFTISSIDVSTRTTSSSIILNTTSAWSTISIPYICWHCWSNIIPCTILWICVMFINLFFSFIKTISIINRSFT